mgnify:CR=1 FL=1
MVLLVCLSKIFYQNIKSEKMNKLSRTELEYLYVQENRARARALCRTCHVVVENDDIPQPSLQEEVINQLLEGHKT